MNPPPEKNGDKRQGRLFRKRHSTVPAVISIPETIRKTPQRPNAAPWTTLWRIIPAPVIITMNIGYISVSMTAMTFAVLI